MLKKLLLVGCFLSMITSLNAQTLAPGDIAIIGTNYDVVPYEMTIVNLVGIPANTVIRITDYGYDETTGTFGTTSVANTSEGSITWTTTALAAGTVTKLTISGGATPVVSGLSGTVAVTGWSNATATNCPVPAGGDNWFIFQGNSPTSINNFIFAWTNTFSATFNSINQPVGQFNVSGSGAPNNNNSYLPPSLTLGTSAIALNRDPSNGGYHGDNNVYTGIFSGTKAEILAEIGNVAKWTRSETVAFNITPSATGSSFSGANPIFTLPNSTPTDLNLSATSVNENVLAGSTVGVLSSVDPDIGNTFTYSLAAGIGSIDNSAFTITGNSLTINASTDFETKSSYSVRVRTTDQGGVLFFEKAFTVTITNINEEPTDIALSTSTINENVAVNTVVGTLSSTDPDAANTFTYTLISGTGDTNNANFNISGSNLRISFIPDFETKSSYSIRIRTADQGSLSYEEVFSITINNLCDIVLTAASQTNVSCFGGSNGAATVNNPTGGTSGYTYNWTPGNPTGDGTPNVTGLTAGTWTCTVTDANSCTTTQSFNVTQPTAALAVTPASQTNIACFGGSNGSASINTPTGGTPGYTYNWTPGNPTGDGTPNVTGLTAGTWTCTVTDANSCTTTQSFNVTQPAAALAVTPASQTNIACFGGSNGSATVNTPTGGTPGYTYDWTPGTPTGDGTTSVTGLTAGTYTVTVTDANGCTATQAFTITQPGSGLSTATGGGQTNVSCNGGTNGTASVAPSGGTPGYTYSWSPSGGTAATATGLAAGSYTVTVTDANGCTATRNYTITQPTAISTATGSQTNVSCNGGSNGSASVTPSGGAGGYTYAWSPSGGTAATATGLSAGTYTVTVIDANFCTTTRDFIITQPTVISTATGSQTNVSCNGGTNGTASVAPSGGTPGYTYSWSPSGGTAATATGLAAGSYTVTVTDANGCTATRNYTITQPTAISTATGSQTNVSCNGGSNGSASVTPFGGAGGYTYAWSPSGGTAATATGLSAGTYTVTVIDANFCTTTRDFTITQPTVISTATGSQTNVSCNGGANGTASVSPSGGTPGYTYSWSPSGGTAATATGLTAGTYTVTVTDANGCTATRSYTITEPSTIDSTVTAVGNTLTANQSGATYQWYNCSDNSTVGTNNDTFTPTQSGDYKVDITIGGCTATSTCITVTTLGTITFENNSGLLIYPNPSQGIINIKSNSNGEFQVVNQLGQVVKTFKVEADVINTVDLQNLSHSVYFIKEINPNTSKSHKLIIKK